MIRKMGWVPDLKDPRDHFLQTVKRQVKGQGTVLRLNEVNPRAKPLPDGDDLLHYDIATVPDELPHEYGILQHMSAIEDQRDIGSCTAFAAVAAVEHFHRKTYEDNFEGSQLFTYKVTRNILRWRGDTGAYIRTVMQALANFGVLPQFYRPYNTELFDQEPTAFEYMLASNNRAVSYARLRRTNMRDNDFIALIKSTLVCDLPIVFGFYVFKSIEQAEVDGIIPVPNISDSPVGGHAILAVGYNTYGLIFRNSWGTEWGNSGYGYLPWEFVTRELADDFWTLDYALAGQLDFPEVEEDAKSTEDSEEKTEE